MPEYTEAEADRKTSREIGLRELRAELGTVVMDVGVRREIAYVMHRGRRIAAIVPLDIAEEAEKRMGDQPGSGTSPA